MILGDRVNTNMNRNVVGAGFILPSSEKEERESKGDNEGKRKKVDRSNCCRLDIIVCLRVLWIVCLL